MVRAFAFGEWLKDYLLQFGTKGQYVSQIHRDYNAFLKRLGYKEVSVQHIINQLYILRKLGLIKLAKTEEAVVKGHVVVRHYYSVIRSKIDDPAWKYPLRAYYKKQESR